jgi:solute carrier family 35 protein C2
VTLSICGIFKEVMTISAAAIIFDDPLTPVNVSGLLVTIVSIAAYNYIKISNMRQEALEQTHNAYGTHPRGDHTTGYAAAAGDTEDDEPSLSQRNRISGSSEQDGVSNAKLSTSLENGYGGSDDIIQFGESATSPAAAQFSQP